MIDSVFPVYSGPTLTLEPMSGLTKRELFAAMMMQGILASGTKAYGPSDCARVVVNWADFLIEELDKPRPD